MPVLLRRRLVLRDARDRHGPQVGALLERAGMPLNAPIHVVGVLEREPSGLVLRADEGGYWQLHQAGNTRGLVGERVEIIGHRIGFNDIACDSIWRAGEPQPRIRKLRLDLLIPAAAVAMGLAASLAGWLG